MNFTAYLTGSAHQAIFCRFFILCCHLFTSSNKRKNSQCGEEWRDSTVQIVPQINGIYTVSHTKVNITFPLFIVGVTCFYRDEMVEYFYML